MKGLGDVAEDCAAPSANRVSAVQTNTDSER